MKYGTTAIAGFDSQSAPHLLDGGVLQQADNVSYAESGAVRPAASDTLVAAATTPLGVGVAMVDSTRQYIFKDGAAVKTASETIASSWGSATSTIRVVPGRDEAVIYDGTMARVWDGDVLRALGTLVGTDGSLGAPKWLYSGASSAEISAVDFSGDAVEVTTSAAHGLTTGDRVYFASVDGITGLDGAVSDVTVTADDVFTLDDVSTDDVSGTYGSSSVVYIDARGEAGTYKYRVSYTLTLPSGAVVESAPQIATKLLQGDEDMVLASAASDVRVRFPGISASDIAGYMISDGDYAVGADYTVGARIYRTKDLSTGGAETYYLAGEVAHATVYESVTGNIEWRDQVKDVELGAAWLDGLDGGAESHDQPPTVDIAVPFAGRLYAVDAGDKSRLYYSHIESYDYWSTLGYFDRTSDIVAMAPFGDLLLVVGSSQAWMHRNPDGVGFWDDVSLPAYPSGQDAVISTPHGVMIATAAGLYIWNGSTAQRISMPVQDEWEAADGSWVGAYGGDKVVWIGNGTTFLIEMYPDGAKWSTVSASSAYQRVAPSPDGIFVQLSDGVYTLGGGSSRTFTIKSKQYVAPGSRCRSFAVDTGALASLTATLTSNRGGSASLSLVNGWSSRKVMRSSFAEIAGDFWELTLTGTGTVYGWEIDLGV